MTRRHLHFLELTEVLLRAGWGDQSYTRALRTIEAASVLAEEDEVDLGAHWTDPPERVDMNCQTIVVS